MTVTNDMLPTGINQDYILVTDDEVLQALCQEWKDRPFLAMDTEFIRTSTFYPRAGLIQINAGDENNYLLDPLALTQWDLFKALMLDSDITKIFHSCSEDLQVFMAEMQLVPTPVFDTQLAGAFLGDGFGCSYQNLVRHYLEIDLPKGETRSDWLQRPLDPKQCHYAALDVACLPVIYQSQKQALVESGRQSWFQEECERLLQNYRDEMASDFSSYYLNIRGAWQLSQKALNRLKLLAAWREYRARKRNKPRNWIVQDKQLLEISRLDPRSLDELATVEDLDRNFMRHEAGEVLAVIKEADNVPAEALPSELPKPLDGRVKSRMRKAQNFVETRAAELGLPVEMLSRKRWLTSLMQDLVACEQESRGKDVPEVMLPDEMNGWRKPLLLPGLMEAMKA